MLHTDIQLKHSI